MDSDLITAVKAGIRGLLIRFPPYLFLRTQTDHFRLRLLLSAQKEYLFAPLSQILPCGQLLNTQPETTVCCAAPDDCDKLMKQLLVVPERAYVINNLASLALYPLIFH